MSQHELLFSVKQSCIVAGNGGRTRRYLVGLNHQWSSLFTSPISSERVKNNVHSLLFCHGNYMSYAIRKNKQKEEMMTAQSHSVVRKIDKMREKLASPKITRRTQWEHLCAALNRHRSTSVFARNTPTQSTEQIFSTNLIMNWELRERERKMKLWRKQKQRRYSSVEQSNTKKIYNIALYSAGVST